MSSVLPSLFLKTTLPFGATSSCRPLLITSTNLWTVFCSVTGSLGAVSEPPRASLVRWSVRRKSACQG